MLSNCELELLRLIICPENMLSFVTHLSQSFSFCADYSPQHVSRFRTNQRITAPSLYQLSLGDYPLSLSLSPIHALGRTVLSLPEFNDFKPLEASLCQGLSGGHFPACALQPGHLRTSLPALLGVPVPLGSPSLSFSLLPPVFPKSLSAGVTVTLSLPTHLTHCPPAQEAPVCSEFWGPPSVLGFLCLLSSTD